MAIINPLVEGDLDAAIAVRLIQHTGHDAGIAYGRRGVGYIREKLTAFNRSARTIIYLAMVDLMDTGSNCPPEVVRAWLPHPRSGMHFRIVVREIESWILADVEAMADFLGVSRVRFDADPDVIPDPKQRLVNIARRSNRRAIRSALVPSAGSTATRGPQYNVELRAFVEQHWDPNRARGRSRSLAKCIDRLASIPR